MLDAFVAFNGIEPVTMDGKEDAELSLIATQFNIDTPVEEVPRMLRNDLMVIMRAIGVVKDIFAKTHEIEDYRGKEVALIDVALSSINRAQNVKMANLQTTRRSLF